MIRKELKLSCGSVIEIYDNVFTDHEMQFFLWFAQKCHYEFGRNSSDTILLNKGSFFSCVFTPKDDQNFSFNNKQLVQKITTGTVPVQSWINATLPGSWYYSHVDVFDQTLTETPITLLYAINEIWNTNHGGETLFYNSYGEKEFALDFTPGRIIKFDGRLKHKPAIVQGNYEPRYMYTCKYFPENHLTNKIKNNSLD